MKISYAIPVCNEHEELSQLLLQLQTHKRELDEIVVQCDKGNTTPEVYKVLGEHLNTITVIEYPLNKDFAAFKNNLKDHCTGDWIFQVDADEVLSEWFIQNLPAILEANDIDLYYVPRINTVDGLTEAHIQQWGWRVDEKGWVNFPDPQTRILRNHSDIKWTGAVHERIVGHRSQAMLPASEEYCILHPKQLDRQIKQNNLYDKIESNGRTEYKV